MASVAVESGSRAPEPAGAAEKRFLVPTLVFLGVVSSAVGSLGAPLLPTIVNDYHVSLDASQWALTISLLVGAVAAPVLGRLGDGRHRRAAMLTAVGAVFAGCALAALPLGFAALLTGRALQGVGLGLVPLAIATARDALPASRSGPVIGLLGVTTAVGIGVGYPLAGLITEHLGLHAAFAGGALVSALGVAASATTLPASPERPTRRIDAIGATLLAAAASGLLLVLAEGPAWGWTSAWLLAVSMASLAAVGGWVTRELRTRQPLIELRLLRHRSVLAANATVLLIGIGIYPLLSLVVRYVQTPPAAGYGFGASIVVAGLMLVPFSAASFVASRAAASVARRVGPELVVALSCVVLLAAMTLFLTARGTYAGVVLTMTLAGFGVGGVFAANPVQIVRGVPPDETGSAMSFYQVLRAVGFSTGSTLSATVLVAAIPSRRVLPTAAGYSAAAAVCIGVLLAALALAAVFAALAAGARRPDLGPPPPAEQRGTPVR